MGIDEITQLAIAWGPTVLFLLIFLIGLLFGLIRGFRKSSILAVHALIALAICLTGYLIIVNNASTDALVVEYVNKFAGDGWIQRTLGVSEGCETLKECLIEFIPKNLNYGDSLKLILQENGAYLGTLVNLAYHLVFAVAASVIYIVLILLLYIIYFIFYPERRYVKKRLKKEATINKKGSFGKTYKKKRLLGSIVGATRGLVSGLVCMSFLGAILFIVAGGTGDGTNDDYEYDFEDQNINTVHSIYKNIANYGETGIFKVLNSIKNKDDVPYYLFAAELVFQGGDVSIDGEIGNNIALTRELTTYTSFARKTLDLVLRCDDEKVIKDLILKPNQDKDIMSLITKIMAKDAFQQEFNTIIDDFESNTYFINLGLSLIDSVCRHIDMVNEDMNLGLSEDVTELLCILFKEGYKSSYIPEDQLTEAPGAYICASALLNEADTKAIIKTLVSLLTIDNVTNMEEGDTIEKVFAISNKVLPTLEKLTIFSESDDNKNVFNPLIQRLFTYSMNRYLPKGDEKMLSLDGTIKLMAEKDQKIDWIKEIHSLFDLSMNTITIGDGIYTPGMDLKDSNVVIDMVAKIFEDTKSTVYNAFGEIKNTLSSSSLLSHVISETAVYDMLTDSIKSIAPETIYIRDDMSFINEYDSEGKLVKAGEITNLLTSVETALSNKDTFDCIKEFMDPSFKPDQDLEKTLDLTKRLATVITTGEDGKTVVDTLLKSDIFSSVLSGLIIQSKVIDANSGIELYIPEDVLVEIDGKPVNIIDNDQLKPVFKSLPKLVDVIKPAVVVPEGQKMSVNAILSGLNDDKLLNDLLSSMIVEGTIVNTLGGVLNGPDLKNFITFPEGYMLDGKAVTKEWIANQEVRSIVKGITESGLDIDKIMNNENPDDDTKILLGEIEKLANKEIEAPLDKKPITILLGSQLLHYSVSGVLLNNPDLEKMYIYVPESAVDANNKSLVKIEQIRSIITAAPDVLNAVGPYLDDKDTENFENINALLDRLPKGEALDNTLESDIVYGTIANALISILNEGATPDKPSFVVIPKTYMDTNSKPIVEKWRASGEVENIINGVRESKFDINAIMSATDENMQDVILTEVKKLGNNTTAQDMFLSSRVLHFTISNALTTTNLGTAEAPIKFYLPDEEGNSVYDTVENESVVQDAQIKGILRTLPKLLDAVEPFLEDNLITPLVTRLTNKEGTNSSALDDVTANVVLHGTMINAMAPYLTSGDAAKFIAVPKSYMDGNTANTKAWIDSDEIKHIVLGVSESKLDIDAIINEKDQQAQQDLIMNQIKGFAGNDTAVNTLLSSNVLHFTISNVLTTTNLGSDTAPIKFYLPNEQGNTVFDTVLNEEVVADTEIKSIIKTLPKLLDVVNPFLKDNLITPLIERLTKKEANENSALDDVTANIVLHGTMINAMAPYLTSGDAAKFIAVPKSYMNGSEANTKVWIENNEIKNIVNGVADSKLDIDAIINEQDQQAQQDLIMDQIEGFANNSAAVDTLLSSKVLHFTISNVLTTTNLGSEASPIMFYLPDEAGNSVFDNVLSESVVADTEIKSIIKTLPRLLGAVKPFLKDNLITPLINNLVKVENGSSALDEVTKNVVLNGTMVNAMAPFLTSGDAAKFIRIPNSYMVDGKAETKLWIENNEIKNIVNGIADSKLDIDAIINEKDSKLQQELIFNQIEGLASNEAAIDTLLSSKVLHFTISNVLETTDLGTAEAPIRFYLPNEMGESVFDNVLSENVVSDAEIKGVLKALPKLLDSVKPFLDDNKITPLIDRLVANDGTGSALDSITNNKVLHGTMVNAMAPQLTGASLSKFVKMPLGYMEGNNPLTKVWIKENEIRSIVVGIKESGLDIDLITSKTGEELQNTILDQVEAMANKQKANPANGPVNILLESHILHNTLSNALNPSDPADSLIKGLTLYIPNLAGVKGEIVIEGNKTEVISESELINTIIAVPQVLSAVNPFLTDNSVNGLVDRLTTAVEGVKPTDDIYKSNILKYTLADQLDTKLKEESISKVVKLPKSYTGVDSWFTNGNEVDNLLMAIKMSKLDIDSLTSGGKVDYKKIVSDIASTGEAVIRDDILKSEIIHTTVSSLLTANNLDVEVIVPTDLIHDELVDKPNIASLMVQIPEILNRVDKQSDLIVYVLDNQVKLFADPILLTTIVNYLNINVFSKGIIKLPTDLEAGAEKSELVKHSTLAPNPWQAEAPLLVNALDQVIDLRDTSFDLATGDVKTRILNRLNEGDASVARAEEAYKSRVMQLTLSSEIEAQANSILTTTVDELGIKNEGIIDISEVTGLLSAFNYLKLDLTSPSFDAIYFDSGISAKINASSIIRRALFENLDTLVVVPTSAVDGLYIKEAQMTELINVLDANKAKLFDLDSTGRIVINSITSKLSNISFNLLSSLQGSEILHATAINKIATLDIANLVIPTSYKNDATDIKNTYLTGVWGTAHNDNELGKLIKAIELFVADRDADITTQISVENIKKAITTANIETMYNSVIVQASMYQPLYDALLATTGAEVLADSRVSGKIDDKSVFLKSEIINALKAIDILELDVNNIDVSQLENKVLGLSSDNVNTLSTSNIIWTSVSNTLGDALATMGVDARAINASTYDFIPGVKHYTSVEVSNLLAAVRAVADNLTSIKEFTPELIASKVLSLDGAKINTIYSSVIAWTTLSDKLDSVLGGAGLNVNSRILNINKDLYKETEINSFIPASVTKLLAALNVVANGKTDVSKITASDVSGEILKLDGAKVNTLNASSILWSIVSDNLNSSLVKFNINSKVLEASKYDLIAKNTDGEAIRAYTSEAITALIGAIKPIAGTETDITKITPEGVTAKVLGFDSNDINTLHNSAIIWAILSDNIDSSVNTLGVKENIRLSEMDEVLVPGYKMYSNNAIVALLEAIKLIKGSEGDLGSIDTSAVSQKIMSFTSADFNTLYESRIVWSILSTNVDSALVNLDTNVDVRNNEKDSTYGLYTKASVESLLNAIKILANNPADISTIDPAVITNRIINLTDMEFKEIKKSNLVWSIMSDKLGAVIAPLNVNSTIITEDTYLMAGTYRAYKYDAVLNLLKGIKVLAPTLDTIQGFDLSVVTANLLSLQLDGLNTMASSHILWFILSDKLDGMFNGNVDSNVLAAAKREIVPTVLGYLPAEVNNIIIALNDLGVSDIDKLNTLDIATLDPAKVSLAYSRSDIIKSFITNKLDNVLDATTLLVKHPNAMEEKTFGVATVKLYKTSEMENLLGLVNKLGGSLSGFSLDKLDLADPEIVSYIKGSAILNATVTDKLIKSNAFVMPNNVFEVGEPKLLKAVELESLIEALNALGIKVNNPSASGITPTVLLEDEVKFNTITNSEIIRATITKLISDAAASAGQTLYIEPTDATIRVASGATIYVLAKEEIKAFIKAISLAGDTSGFGLSFSLESIKGLTPQRIYEICESTIAMALISDTIIATGLYTKEVNKMLLGNNPVLNIVVDKLGTMGTYTLTDTGANYKMHDAQSKTLHKLTDPENGQNSPKNVLEACDIVAFISFIAKLGM